VALMSDVITSIENTWQPATSAFWGKFNQLEQLKISIE
jgi:hypothetical protein